MRFYNTRNKLPLKILSDEVSDEDEDEEVFGCRKQISWRRLFPCGEYFENFPKIPQNAS